MHILSPAPAPRAPLAGAALAPFILSGTLALVAALCFGSGAVPAAWRPVAGDVCLGASFASAALALWLIHRAAQQWRTRALHAQAWLMPPPPPVEAQNPIEAITAPLPRIVAPASAVAPDPLGQMPHPHAAVQPVASLPALHDAVPLTPRGVVYDPLTGASTLSALMTHLEAAITAALTAEQTLALALFDIDNFHTINLLYGYGFGDEVLFAVAERIRRHLGAGMTFARLGADRFAVLWAGATVGDAAALTTTMRAAASDEPYTLPNVGADGQDYAERVRITLRAGLALCPDDGQSAAALLASAEAALNPHPLANPLRAEHRLAPPQPSAWEASQWAGLPPTGPLPSEPQVASYLDVLLEENGSLQALASALEVRDVMGVAHARNLAELAQETALLLSRSVEESRLVGLAALLHDVGTLGIPDAILTKADPLSPEEWAFVREHPHLGERLLTSVGGVLAAVAPIIAAQRERWDGTGYPLGTRGAAIPLGARIVAVCAVYSALVSARPYRPAFTHAEALGELERCAGTQFDPEVVAAFISAASA